MDDQEGARERGQDDGGLPSPKLAVPLSERLVVLQQCVAHLPVPVAMFDRQLRYIVASAAWSAQYHVPTQLEGLSHYDLFPDLPERWKAAHRRALEGAIERSECDAFVRPDGRCDWVRWEVRPWHDTNGDIGGIVIFTEIITERVESEQRLHQSEERLRGVLDAIPHAIMLVDPQGTLLYANESFQRDLGSEEAMRTPAQRMLLVDEADRAAMAQKLQERLHGSAPMEAFPVRLRCTDGTYRRFVTRPVTVRDAHGRMSYGVTTLTDENERLLAEEAWRASEQRRRQVMDAIPHCIIVTDIDGQLRYLNQFGRDLLGDDDELRTPEARAARVHPDDQELAQAHRTDLHDGRFAQRDRFETRLRCRDGRYRWFSSRVVTLHDASGAPESHVYTLTNEDAQRELQQQLFQAQKIEAIGQLAGGVAHDFNNMLMVVLGQAEAIEDEVDLPAQVRADLVDLRLAAERAASLTQQLLTFARRQEMHAQALDLNELIGLTTNIVRRALTTSVRLVVELAPTPLRIRADANMITQVLVNLAVNARDAMVGGGQLTLRLAMVTLSAEQAATIAGARAGSWARLSVSDTGAGIDPAVLGHIFEPFYTTKEVGKGTGLGLAVVHGIVEQHQGFIDVRSTPGNTTFEIHLPLTQDVPDVAVAQPQLPIAQQGAGELILVVEDETAVRGMIERCLKDAGYRVITATHGREGLDAYHCHRDRIRLLLTDATMPGGMSGAELAARIRDVDATLPVVISSGYHPDVVAGGGAWSEQIVFLQKPYVRGQLLELVARLLAGAQR